MMNERGMSISHTTLLRWVHHYAKEIEKRVRPYLKTPNDSWRIDETYIKVKGKWMYLYRAVDSSGQTIDFYFSCKRNEVAAKCFLKKMLNAKHTESPRVMTVDKHPAYKAAFFYLKYLTKKMPLTTMLRQCKYLNNIIEQDHRRIKKKTRSSMGYQSYHTAYKTIRGIEIIHMLRKGQLFHLFDKSAKA